MKNRWKIKILFLLRYSLNNDKKILLRLIKEYYYDNTWILNIFISGSSIQVNRCFRFSFSTKTPCLRFLLKKQI